VQNRYAAALVERGVKPCRIHRFDIAFRGQEVLISEGYCRAPSLAHASNQAIGITYLTAKNIPPLGDKSPKGGLQSTVLCHLPAIIRPYSAVITFTPPI
jgi:hypothetical protein